MSHYVPLSTTDFQARFVIFLSLKGDCADRAQFARTYAQKVDDSVDNCGGKPGTSNQERGLCTRSPVIPSVVVQA
jgi:hypothetical protein